MANQEASVEQIALFKQGAASQYRARGVKPELADQLFNRHMDTVAKELQGKKVVATAKQ